MASRGLRSAGALIGALAAMAMASPVLAQAQLLGDHSSWSAYEAQAEDGRICFVMSAPTATSPQTAGTGDAHFYVTHRVAGNVRSEPNFVSGYAFAPDSTATVTVGERSFLFVTAGEGAWLGDTSQSETLVGVMRAGATMTVSGTSEAGTAVTQTFSLSGVTAATDQINQAC